MGGLNYAELTPVQRAAYVAALSLPAQRTGLRASVLDLDHKYLADMSRDVTGDGAVTLDRNNDVERSATIGVVDLDGELADLDLRHLVRVEHSLYVPALDEWVFTPVITGRVVAPTDNGDAASLELHGKESFGLMPGAPTRTWPKGRYVAQTIRDMHEDIGERFINISPGLLSGNAPRLASPVGSGGADQEKAPTRVSRRLGNKHGLQVFHDPLGVLQVRRPPTEPLVTWAEDSDESVTPLVGRISWTRDLREVRNVVRAKGRRTLALTVEAPAEHIFSPQSLKRGGVPGRIVHYWENRSIAREPELRRRAREVLDGLLTERTNATFEAAPVFHVGQHDLIEARRRDGKWGQWWLSTASIPFDTGGGMTVGYLPNVRGRTR